MAYLVVAGPGREPFRRNLESNKPTIVGRAREADLWIDDPRLSRRHCKLERIAGQWTIEDLGSRNGTFAGEHRVKARTTLKDADSFEIGDTRVTFHADSYIGSRPADPAEAMRAQQMLSDPGNETLVHHEPPRSANAHPLPTPKPRKDESANPAEEELPLPFARPPAQPMVEEEPHHLRWWLGSVLTRRKARDVEE